MTLLTTNNKGELVVTATVTDANGNSPVVVVNGATPNVGDAAQVVALSPNSAPLKVEVSADVSSIVANQGDPNPDNPWAVNLAAGANPVTVQGIATIQGNQPPRTAGVLAQVGDTVLVPGASNLNVATVTVSGTYSGLSMVFEGSDDSGVTWYQMQGGRTDASLIEAQPAGLLNAVRAWDIAVGGFNQIRVRCVAILGGAANVAISLQAMPYEPTPTVGLSNVGGTAFALGAQVAAASIPVTHGYDDLLVKLLQQQIDLLTDIRTEMRINTFMTQDAFARLMLNAGVTDDPATLRSDTSFAS